MLKRKKVRGVEVIKEDVIVNSHEMLVPINKKIKKVVGGKKLPDNIPSMSLDNTSFHSKRVCKNGNMTTTGALQLIENFKGSFKMF